MNEIYKELNLPTHMDEDIRSLERQAKNGTLEDMMRFVSALDRSGNTSQEFFKQELSPLQELGKKILLAEAALIQPFPTCYFAPQGEYLYHSPLPDAEPHPAIFICTQNAQTNFISRRSYKELLFLPNEGLFIFETYRAHLPIEQERFISDGVYLMESIFPQWNEKEEDTTKYLTHFNEAYTALRAAREKQRQQ